MPHSSFKLELSREQIEQHLHSVPFAAALFDGEGNVVEANAILLQATGHTYEQIKTKKYNDLFLTRDSFRDWMTGCKTIAQESQKAPRMILKLKTGRTCTCNLIIYSEAKKTEQVYHYLLMTNIEENKTEGFLLPFYNQIIENVNLGIIIFNKQGVIYEVSWKACELLGVKKEHIINRTFTEAFADVRDHFISPSILEGVTVRNHAHSWRNGEKRFQLIVDSDVFRLPNGEIAGGYYLFKDVSNMHSIGQQIERKDRLAMIGQIAAGTAHEIRNPLTSINGFLQMMQKSLAEAGLVKETEYTKIMLMEIKRINDLVSEFLLLSKPRQVQYQIVDVEQVFKEILPIVKNEALLHGIDVVVESSEALPSIIGDGELLKQVLLNVTKNGIEAMEDKGVLTLRFSLVGNQIEIAVQDTGHGIPPYLLDKIFDPFFTTKEEGTGLGLPVCQKIIHDMGGTIRVSSKGNGTTFYITLPSC
ncbi:ATP-binding protein [Aneurinibacillus sp. Ricciae_BoGa-3]|uniref:PAS domain-containing sensor histidine kinase n=1 Tax=Aneurinibacillus sp. Ricciae_BoGa-3 TaxID=3022697 RepID=UPI0023423482|nr:PAS domain-containing sensor histidine kinase [Aneurinibacillus sp. Ricciae_BoGa-3]WCK54601.1 ATP-binding protein [Aneurinibacillus sp. Ricciae_BoGa-3]